MSKITNEKNYVQKGDSLREQSREVPEFPGYTTSFDWRTARSILCTSANQEEFFHSNNEQEGLSNVILIYTDVCRLGIKSSRLGQRIYHSTEILA